MIIETSPFSWGYLLDSMRASSDTSDEPRLSSLGEETNS